MVWVGITVGGRTNKESLQDDQWESEVYVMNDDAIHIHDDSHTSWMWVVWIFRICGISIRFKGQCDGKQLLDVQKLKLLRMIVFCDLCSIAGLNEKKWTWDPFI